MGMGWDFLVGFFLFAWEGEEGCVLGFCCLSFFQDMFFGEKWSNVDFCL